MTVVVVAPVAVNAEGAAGTVDRVVKVRVLDTEPVPMEFIAETLNW